jgi:mono/diheme cytochrome c family protein
VALLFRSVALLLGAAAAFLAILAALTGTAHGYLAGADAASTSISPTVAPPISATATIDRLAAPPTVEPPTQADDGAQLFWLHCQPCHGDRGQGLTDEWRDQYPPEDRNCWESGCHGDRPYENGFTLPTTVPPVVGDGSLERFETLGQVHAFIQAAMPFQDPGHLTEEEYLAITAFLARAHGVWDGKPLDASNVHTVRLNAGSSPGEAESAGEQQPATPAKRVAETATVAGASTTPDSTTAGPAINIAAWVAAIALLLVVAAGFIIWRRHGR